MLFARDKSQMCNNLLQFAHVYAWAREHNRSVMSMRFSYKYRFFKISHSRYVSFPLYLFAKYMAALRLLPTASFKYADCDAMALEQKMLRHRHIVVSGWNVRFYDLFLKYRSEIVDLFTIDEAFTVPVKEKMVACEEGDDNIVRLGVHIRRGDYKDWQDGRFFYDDETYAAHIRQFASLFPERQVHVYLSTNDPLLVAEKFQVFTADCKNLHIHLLMGNAVEDLFMLSECDYLIGPPSTYSLVASMYRDITLYRMDSSDHTLLTLTAFKPFDYWFRRIL
jgi:hypothetical protein